jgi:hypothetical protein
MHALTPAELLEVWELGMRQANDQKALTLLRAALPEETWASLAQWSIGRRNALLLSVREGLFGPQFIGAARCPACAERLELNFRTDDIRATPTMEVAEPLTLEASDYQVIFRLPTSEDLALVRGYEDAEVVARLLLKRCLLSVRRRGEETSVEALPAEIVEAVEKTMGQADPQANIQLSLTCPGCGHQWLAHFDILTYIWKEMDAWARRVLREVHYLASAYGWSETDILNMRPWRRHLYLDMIGR